MDRSIQKTKYLKMKKNLTFGVFLLLSLGWTGCNKILETKPVSSLELNSFYNSKESAEIGLTGCYNRFYNQSAYSQLICFFLVSTDDVKEPPGSWGFELKDRTLLTSAASSGGGYNTSWAQIYQAIANVNLLLEGVAKIPDEKFTNNRKKQILAEGHFLRGLCYYYLTMLWRDVPLVLELKTGGPQDNLVAKSTQAEVLKQVKTDLQIAESDLPDVLTNYSDDATTNARKGRASKWAAKAYLARIALWENDLPKALQLSQDVIASNKYPLATKWRSVFEEPMNGSESILEQQNDRSPGFFGSGLGAWFLGFVFQESDQIFTLYNTPAPGLGQGSDIRFDFMVAPHPWSSGQLCIRKHVPPRGYENSGVEQLNFVLIRAPELYFNKYEILAQQDYAGSKQEALDFLNTIRARAKDDSWVNPYYNVPAGTTGIPALTLSDIDTPEKLLNAIKEEKRREMVYEDGIRWFDLMRWDRAYARAITKSPSDDYLYLPLPQDEILRNKALIQNPVYK